MKTWVCSVCGWIYDEEKGDPDYDLAPGVPFEELPDDAWFTMHAITYRTSLLRDNGVTITEHLKDFLQQDAVQII